jgi:hypothetical protein
MSRGAGRAWMGRCTGRHGSPHIGSAPGTCTQGKCDRSHTDEDQHRGWGDNRHSCVRTAHWKHLSLPPTVVVGESRAARQHKRVVAEAISQYGAAGILKGDGMLFCVVTLGAPVGQRRTGTPCEAPVLV